MLAGDIYEPSKIRLVDVAEPKLNGVTDGAGEIIFQPEVGCLCGSDVPYFTRDYAEFLPVVGQSLHEIVGTVVETNGRRFKPGDKVLCVPPNHLGLFERFATSAERAIPLDPRVSTGEALLAQPLGTVVFALKKLPTLVDLDVAIVGQGPMGQLLTAAARNLGARHVIAIDRLASRLAVSPKMGANAVVDSSVQDPIEVVRELTGGAMADLVVEAVGHYEQAFNLCVDLCRPGGRILYFGVPPQTIDGVRLRDAMWKNLTIHTSVNPDFRRDFPLAMRWIGEGRINVAPLITHRFPLAMIQTAFETFRDRRDGAIKVFVEF